MHAVESLTVVPSRTAALTMRAIVHRQYGAPEVLGLEEVALPVPGAEEVRVRVHAAAATMGDLHVVTGKPYLIRITPFGGLPRPRNPVPGQVMAGRVDAVGAKVTAFRVGDEVFGQASTGAFAEYLVMPAKMLAPKPGNLSFEEAATVPWAATALVGLRDAAGLKAGQRVLINGASGGVGTWAVQIAKALGASVTAICSTPNVARMRALGADEVIDYTAEDFAKGGARFDVVFDLVANRPFSDFRSVLVPGGTLVPCGGDGGDWFGPMFDVLGGVVSSLFRSTKFKPFVMAPSLANLMFLKELVEAGKARPTVERVYPLSEAAQALKHVGEGHAQGQVVIRIAGK